MTDPSFPLASDDEPGSPSPRGRRLRLLALWIVIAAAFFGGLWFASHRYVVLRALVPLPETVTTIPPDPSVIGGPFALIDQNGRPVTDADFHGKFLLVFFGYTSCPDMCPTALHTITEALADLGEDASKVQPLFISVDPDRDTPGALKDYVAAFAPSLIGLTGSPAQIAAVAKAYKVYYAKAEQIDEDDYVMDHTTLTYFMGPDGRYLASFPIDSDAEAMAEAIRAKLACCSVK